MILVNSRLQSWINNNYCFTEGDIICLTLSMFANFRLKLILIFSGTNALAQTVVRSLFDSIRSLASRLIITIFAFGWDETVRPRQDSYVKRMKF